MALSRFLKLAAAQGAAEASQRYGVDDPDPVKSLTSDLQQLDEPSRPYWLYEEKKRDDGRDTSWGPPTPLHAGDSAERNPSFNSGLGIQYGGV